MSQSGTLVVSISGIRGIFGDGLDAQNIVKYATAFGTWCRQKAEAENLPPLIIMGRDARVTGELCANLVASALRSVGCDVIDNGLATTPTVEYGVLVEHAMGGVVLSASHNPVEWNALKLLGRKGEFLRQEEAEEMLAIAANNEQEPVTYERVGSYRTHNYLDAHIQAILDLPYINADQIAERGFKVVVDTVNSVGSVAMPALLEKLGIRSDNLILLNGNPNGLFAHNPEPLPAHLTETIQAVADHDADLGIVVDPDVDRLALIMDGGVFMSEELTQVMTTDFMLGQRRGPVVTNLSSSRAIEDVAARYGVTVHRSPVGEINVVNLMYEVDAVIGGEGSGGIIVPDLHHGRDALVGAALVLQHLTNIGQPLSEYRKTLPDYFINKAKISIGGSDPDVLLAEMAGRFAGERMSTVDGVKIDFEEGWVHMRKSNTEPIIRIYSEGASKESAEQLANRFMEELGSLA